MRKWITRVRGIFGIGAAWGGLGALIASAVGLGGVLLGQLPMSGVGEIALGAAGLGLLLGSGFATALTLFEGRRSLDELTVRRSALWGGLVGAATPLAILVVAIAPAIGLDPLLNTRALLAVLSGSVAYGGVCAALAAATVAIAKRDLDKIEGAAREEATSRLTGARWEVGS